MNQEPNHTARHVSERENYVNKRFEPSLEMRSEPEPHSKKYKKKADWPTGKVSIYDSQDSRQVNSSD